MNFLLKIVEGPNKGAEVALVEGVAVTLGKADDCDVVLADPTLPDAPFRVEATNAGVTFDGEPLEPYHVKAAGSTAFAVGPADGAWGELVWPQVEKEKAPAEEPAAGDGAADAGRETKDEGHEEPPASGDLHPPADSEPEKKRRHGCVGCLVWLIVLLLVLLGLGWFFRNELRPRIEQVLERTGVLKESGGSCAVVAEDVTDQQVHVPPKADLSALAAKYCLSLTNADGKAVLSGNFRTRAERLVATAEAYAEHPGVGLDLSDDESFGTAAADALFTLTEGALRVEAATNRVLSITGVSPSANALKKTLKALNADLPRLRDVDVTGVALGVAADATGASGNVAAASGMPVSAVTPRRPRAASREPQFPVCGILATPYPCLVMQNGARVLEGATIGDSTILKITADSVVVTNASGRFTWKP